MAQQALLEAAILTFGELGFLFASESPDEEQRAFPLDTTVRVDFAGPFDGTVEVRIASALLRTLAANMMGEEAPLSTALLHDALKEATNVICGNVLPIVATPKAVFQLSPPYMVASPDVDADTLGELQGEIEIGLDEARAMIRFYLRSA